MSRKGQLGLVIACIALFLAFASIVYASQQERICIRCAAGRSDFIWGSDLYFFSDEASTQKLHIDGATGNVDGEGTLDVAGAATFGSTADVAGAFSYGASNLYPLGFASDGYQAVIGSITVTNSQTVTHGLTTPTYGLCAFGSTLTDNEEQKCSVVISGTTVTLYTYKEDGSAGDSGVDIYYQIVGTP